jgi:hypothetical protein
MLFTTTLFVSVIVAFPLEMPPTADPPVELALFPLTVLSLTVSVAGGRGAPALLAIPPEAPPSELALFPLTLLRVSVRVAALRMPPLALLGALALFPLTVLSVIVNVAFWPAFSMPARALRGPDVPVAVAVFPLTVLCASVSAPLLRMPPNAKPGETFTSALFPLRLL